jgi:hypothetical protein
MSAEYTSHTLGLSIELMIFFFFFTTEMTIPAKNGSAAARTFHWRMHCLFATD